MNGDEVEVRYGDEVISLPERLERTDRRIRRVEFMLYAGGVLIFLHAFRILPLEDALPYLLNLIGL